MLVVPHPYPFGCVGVLQAPAALPEGFLLACATGWSVHQIMSQRTALSQRREQEEKYPVVPVLWGAVAEIALGSTADY